MYRLLETVPAVICGYYNPSQISCLAVISHQIYLYKYKGSTVITFTLTSLIRPVKFSAIFIGQWPVNSKCHAQAMHAFPDQDIIRTELGIIPEREPRDLF